MKARKRHYLKVGLKTAVKILLFSILIIVVTFTTYNAIATYVFNHKHANDPTELGVSFSVEYAQELGLDWRQTYNALLKDAGVRRFRLMSYWDELEQQPGKINFSDLDYQMNLADQYGAKVSLAIGLRQPRWPECHEPDWAKKLPQEQEYKALDDFIGQVVNRYKNYPALDSYQLENEALNTVFGTCKDFSRQRMETELKLVKNIDPSHPVIISVSNEFGYPVGQPQGDEVGFSIYRRVYDSKVTHGYFNYPFPALWFRTRAAVIELYSHHRVVIHELQTEPWGPKPTVDMTVAEQDQSMDATRMRQVVKYAEDTGIKEIYLWGGEWWYWRLTKFHDPSLWNAAKDIFAHPTTFQSS